MIVVTLELWPHGDESRKTVLGRGFIANAASGTAACGNYRFALAGKGGERIFRRGEVLGFPRRRLLAWDLLLRVLRRAFGERNP